MKDANNLSLFALSPILWVISLVVLGLVALRLAPSRWGWAAAVALSVLATPRLLSYQLSTLLAGFGGPDVAEWSGREATNGDPRSDATGR